MISTMTPDLLESLVSSFLVHYSTEDKKIYNASNWSRGSIVEKLTSDGGGSVYYYSFMKIHNLQDRKEIINDSINQLLAEAKKLKELEEWDEIVSIY